MISLINTGKRLDNIVSYIKNQSPQDTWIIDSIVPLFLEAINQNLSSQEEKLIISKVNQLIDSYEFRYGKIFENNSLITEVSDETLDLQQKFFNDMLVNKSKIVQRYGKDAEKVMKGKAMNLAKKETEKMNKQKLKELVRKTLTMDEVEENKVFAPGELDFSSYITDEQKMIAKAFMVDPSKTTFKNNTVIFTPPISVELNDGSTVMLKSVKMGNRFGFIKGYFDENGDEIPSISIKMPSKNKMGEGKKADKDYDKDGKIESSEEEYKGVKDKAIKKAMGKEVKEAYGEEVESLALTFKDPNEFERAKQHFESNSDFYPFDVNDEFKTFYFQAADQEDADSTEFYLNQELEGETDLQGYYFSTESSPLSEDLDLGHEDNEPHMIKGELYKIGKYAMELYQMVDGFEGKGEVDFPAWWQAKITKACSMIGSAKHYLEFELKEPEIDAMVGVAADEDILDDEAPMMNEAFTIDTWAASGGDTVEDILNDKGIDYTRNASKITIMLDRNSASASSILSHLKNKLGVKFDEVDDEEVAAQRQRERQRANVFTEKKLTKAEKAKKEDIVKGMKKSFKGDESAMYAIATAKAKKVAETIVKKLKND